MERAGIKELNEIADHDSSLQFDMGFYAGGYAAGDSGIVADARASPMLRHWWTASIFPVKRSA